jgi:hypothetical protein
MNCLRLLFILLALLAQAWPVQAGMLGGSPQPACEMGCCAAMAETGMQSCGCLEEPATVPASPVLPVPAAHRQILAEVVWRELEPLGIQRPSQTLPTEHPRDATAGETRTPHVRRSVLYCSLLN